MFPNAKLARLHFENIKAKKPIKDVSDTTVLSMYSKMINYKPIADLCKKILSLTNDTSNQRDSVN